MHSNLILESDLVIISPGISDKIDIVKKCKNNSIPIISEVEFASWFTNSPIIAVTGSNGKSTTVNIIYNIFKLAKIDSQLGGNFGLPFSEMVINEKNNPSINYVHILELSSFQLEHIIDFNPDISAILNISPDHLNRYDSMESYVKAKLNIIKNLREPGWLIYNSGDILLSDQLHDYDRVLPFSRNYCNQALLSLKSSEIIIQKQNEKLLSIKDINIIGDHNIENVLAAATIALVYGIDKKYIKKGILDYLPLPYRLELIDNNIGIKIYNDSKSTNLSSTISAINSIKNNLILILGGQDKNNTNFKELIPILKEKIKLVITYGDAANKINKDLSKQIKSELIPDFKNAVIKSILYSNKNDTILLSPACASFDQFKDYKERGEYFNEIIKNFSYENNIN